MFLSFFVCILLTEQVELDFFYISFDIRRRPPTNFCGFRLTLKGALQLLSKHHR